jgi:hypothetical protein
MGIVTSLKVWKIGSRPLSWRQCIEKVVLVG